KTHPYKAGFEPFASEVYRLPFADCNASCNRNAASEAQFSRIFEDAFKRIVAADSVAAVILEPVLGEGGFYVPPVEFVAALQRICRERGILVIADEIQTGFARTGRMFASEHFGLEPDLLLTAKTLGGGLPLSAVTGRAEIMDHTAPGSLGGTFGGNPVACEAALATIETIERNGLCHRARLLGERFRQRALGWRDRHSFIADVRGLGAMQAIEFVRDGEHEGLAGELTAFCLLNGVIVLAAGTYSNVVRLLMPLVITDAEFDEALDVLERGLTAVEAGAVAEHGAGQRSGRS
ncbi:MAG: aminotransferase class III-fold pyridoxal phosphate-dependent enzyme, partial [Acidobacteriaceae bacterium]|nr:aminotransferase class III-fold pyridoxal phosphate-dependent enzyme [Acidobacteriaceae bacterium]